MLRPYQYSGVREIFAGWDIADHLMWILGTGGGKTVVAADIIRAFLIRKMRVMFIADRENLILQTAKSFNKQKIFTGIIMGSRPTNYEIPTQVCSIQTIIRRAQLPHADLIIIDEAHGVTDANSYATILAKYPNAKVLMLTATPYRLSGEGFEVIVPGKAVRLILGPDSPTLINDGWLVPLDCYVGSLPDRSFITSLSKGDYKDDEAEKAMQFAPVVQSYKDHCLGMPGICFAQNVRHSIYLTGQYWRDGIPAEHMDADTPFDDYKDNSGNLCKGRDSIFRDYTAGFIKMIINVGIINKGTDFDICRVIQLAKMTKSLSNYVQMVGRATRPLDMIREALSAASTAAERRAIIASSLKPDAKILDNAGLWLEHNAMPDAHHDWEYYFKGTRGEKRKKKDNGEIEVWVYEVEDEGGQRKKTKIPEETVGLKLIQVTKEVRAKAFVITSHKKFDAHMAMHLSTYAMKRKGVGFSLMNDWLTKCEAKKEHLTEEMWDYMKQKMVTEIDERIAAIERNRAIDKSRYPDEMYFNTITALKNQGVPLMWLMNKKKAYFEKQKQTSMF